VLVAADNGIWLSEDEGVTWTPPAQKLVMSSVVANSSKPGQFFAGSKKGVWMSNDGGKSWVEYGNGLTDRDITRLEIDVKNSLLYAGTQHAGVMRLSLRGQGK
jgi:ligand-binding sensor domain-containing protein